MNQQPTFQDLIKTASTGGGQLLWSLNFFVFQKLSISPKKAPCFFIREQHGSSFADFQVFSSASIADLDMPNFTIFICGTLLKYFLLITFHCNDCMHGTVNTSNMNWYSRFLKHEMKRNSKLQSIWN